MNTGGKHRPSRRQLVAGGAAGLLLSPFVSLLRGRRARADTARQAKRVLLFCTMGTNPDIWTPSGVVSDTQFTLAPSTQPLAAIQSGLVMVEGCPSLNPGNGHGAPDGLTGLGYDKLGSAGMISVDQFIADKLIAAGVQRPIPSLLLGAQSTSNSGGKTMFLRAGNNLSTIASPLSAFNTVFGGALPAGMPVGTLLKRRKSVLDLLGREITELNQSLGATERTKLALHLASLRQIETRIAQQSNLAVAGCSTPATIPGNDTTDALTADLAHLDIILGAFACDITRVAAIQFGSDQSLPVNLPGLQGDEHSGFIHSGAPDYKNLIAFEQWLAQRFVDVVNQLKLHTDPSGVGTLYDSTLVVWCRDMGDAVNHNQKNMRFVLAGGAGGYLKTAPSGRYVLRSGQSAADRHERVLLAVCQAMGITDFTGFGDPALGANKTPLPGLAA
jgi:Protein of unknown function (DUF1552)